MVDVTKFFASLISIIKDYEGKGLSEDDTRRVIIEPVFEIAGWNLRNLEEIRSNRSQDTAKRPDYEFFTENKM